MARKIQTVTITAEGRDKGKVFQITEMPASRAEMWALRALLAIGRSGIKLPDGIEKMGFAGIVSYGINLITQLPYDEAEYLLGEMFTCVQIMPDSPSLEVFSNWINAMDAIREILKCTANISLPAIGKKYTLSNGVLVNYKPIPDVKKVMQAVPFKISWERVVGENI